MSIRNQLRRCAWIGALGLLAAGSASAQLITNAVGPGNQFIAGGALVPLLGMTTAPFFNAANQRFVASFSAECAVNAPAGNHTAFTDIDIVVLNGAGAVVQTLAPTLGGTDAFCTANGTPVFDGWTRASATVVGGVGLAAGFYRVQVRGRVPIPFSASYGDRSLVVSR
ncbi:hypothetical protein [Piscinibacter sp. XHJ-5]|uniref:hypothetical protein n=1 Tax=Piscinibacter sp. XHJ-5 TaxID=3037797 RepID=UPI002453082C|nr:hypothetical protein [Piscinibacter sp. XHJ-5]